MTESRILTVTLNPAVDMCTSVDRLMPFHKMRCGEARRDAGGGGINVARVVRRLGGDPVALFPAGGPIGSLLEKLLAAEHVSSVAMPIAGDTREDITVDERMTGAQLRFILPGPPLSPDEIVQFLGLLKVRLPQAGYVVASGSLPPGVSADLYTRISQLAATAAAKLILDSSGTALAAAVDNGVYMIKPSLRELRELTGETLTQEGSWLDAARTLVKRRRVEFVALTLGEMGALLVGTDLALRATAPKVTPVSTVGCGDSFLGALVWALAQGLDMRAALRLAVASGTAAMLSPGTDLSHPAEIERLKTKVEIHEI